MTRYTVTREKPDGPCYHGPGNPFTAAGLARYHEANSLSSVRHAARRGYDWIDLDVMLTKDLVFICCHSFGLISKEHFAAAGVPNLPVDQLTWEQVRRLRGPKGARVYRLAVLLAECQRVGIGAAVDLKGDAREGWRIVSAAQFSRLASIANLARARVYVHADCRKRNLRLGLRYARLAGFWTRANGTRIFREPVTHG
jgi:Glycerophosphoryl diester phosphodiesterase